MNAQRVNQGVNQEVKLWTVAAEFAGMKLHDFIHQQLGETLSLRQIKRAIEENSCRLNGRSERFASTRVGTGDRIAFQTLAKPLADLLEGRVLYEDADLFAYDKPPRLSCEDTQLMSLLSKRIPGVHLIHRLDKETTGVLLFSKNEAFREAMIHLFRQHAVQKTYLALVDGIPIKQAGVVDNYLGRIQSYAGQAIWGSVAKAEGQHARTEWKLLRKGKGAALFECHPITGRTHQIRVHLSGLGHPILGDHPYGRTIKNPYFAPRCFLHASEIAFIHPALQKPLRIRSPIPADMLKALEDLFP